MRTWGPCGEPAWNNASASPLPDEVQPRRSVPDFGQIPYFRDRSIAFSSFAFLVFLSGCGARPECDSFETRDAVLHAVSDDSNNALVTYAARHSSAVEGKSDKAGSDAERSAILESAKRGALYLLGERIVTTSTSRDKRTLTCSGSMSVAVDDERASKEVDFTVQQSSDGKISVSVAPFQF
jgi:hypothetical protein